MGDVQVISTTFPTILLGIWQKHEVMHLQFNGLVDKSANCNALADGEGTKVNSAAGWRGVSSKTESIDPRAILGARLPTLIENIRVRFKSV